MTESFGRLLRRLRARAGLTVTELAKALGASRMSIVEWEKGTRVPRDRARLEDLAQVLKLSSVEADQLAAAARSHRLPPEAAAPPAAGAEPAHADRAAVAPALALRHQLRAAVGDFVGRTAEIAQLREALSSAAASGGSAAISGVQGMGGIGKTELAYRVAHELRDAFPDAQIVLALRGSGSTPLAAEQALQTVIRTFTPETRLPEDLAALEPLYRSALHNRRVLLVADDAKDAAQVRSLLPPPGSALLLTSRVRFTLPAMTTVDLGVLGEAEAVTLLRSLCERLSEKDAQALARACGGLPLALRVGGSILHNDPALSVATYLQNLADERQRLTLLRDEDDGQLDVGATLALSYAQLDRDAQQVFRQLGALVADFTTGLAQAVVAAPADVDVAATLRLLLRRNLLMYDLERDRWRLHDLLRDLARRELERAAEWEPAMWRYAQSALHIAQETQDQYLAGDEGMLLALSRFDAERAHIHAARRWAAEYTGTLDGDQLLLEAAAATIHIGRLRFDAGRERIPLWQSALEAARRLGDRRGEGVALNSIGNAYWELGNTRCAITYYEQRLTIAREIGDRRGEGVALNNLGNAYYYLGEARRAIPYLEHAIVIAREVGDRRLEGLTLNNLGNAYYYLGEARRAIPYLEQSLAIAREIGDRHGEGRALHNLGNTYTSLGDTWRAVEACEGALTIARAIGDRRLEGYALSYLAHTLAIRGDVPHATASFEQTIALFRAVGDLWGEAECQWQVGLALAGWGEREQALPLLRAALAYEQEIKHAKAREHAALIARLEAGELLPAEQQPPTGQRAVGDDEQPSTDDSVRAYSIRPNN